MANSTQSFALAGALAPQLRGLLEALDELTGAVFTDLGAEDVVIRPRVLDMPNEELKRQIPGALLGLNDGKFGWVPVSSGVVERAGGVRVRVALKDGPTAERDAEWLDANVLWMIPGCTVTTGHAGAFSKLKVGDVPATLSVVLEDPIASGVITVAGAAQAAAPLRDCIDKLGLQERSVPWLGGARRRQLRAGGGLPTAGEAEGVRVPLQVLVGGGPRAPIRVAKLGLAAGAGSDEVKAQEAAGILGGVCGLDSEERLRALTVALATSQADVTAGRAEPGEARDARNACHPSRRRRRGARVLQADRPYGGRADRLDQRLVREVRGAGGLGAGRGPPTL